MATEKQKRQVWRKASPIRGKNPDTWGKDSMGNKIRYGSHGTHGEFGWEIDHKKPVSKGGSDSPRNLQPLHHEANRRKGNKYP